MIKTIDKINAAVKSFAWGPVMLLLLVGTGVFLSVRMGFPQVRRFGFVMRKTAGSLFRNGKKDDGANLSPFQAVSTALAGTVGTGSIAGVTGAIFTGGPGAVFWMWVSAFFGMCTKYAEIALAMKYRRRGEDGAYRGGPMYYIENGLGRDWKWLASAFAVLGGLASFGIGNIAQSNEIAGVCGALFGVKPLVSGVVLALVVGGVIIGGVRRVGQVTAFLVPFMSVFYVFAGVLAVVLRIDGVPAALRAIVTGAFSFKAAGGGVFGCAIFTAMRQGFSRGVFSNEAGLGSAPIAHASSAGEPCEQALWGVFEVFFDTVVICTVTSMAVLLSGFELSPEALSRYASSGAAAAAAFNSILPGSLGGFIIELSLLFFALSTIIGWSYYGERCWGYLTNDNKTVNLFYRVLFTLMCAAGATGSGKLMWDISDTLNGLMAIPNLIALLGLSGVAVRMSRDSFGWGGVGSKKP